MAEKKKPSPDKLDCPKNDCWIEIEIRDELNKPVGGLSGTLTDSKGAKRQVTLKEGKNLFEKLPGGEVKLAFDRKDLLKKTMDLPMRSTSASSEVPKHAQDVEGHEKTKCHYSMVSYADLMAANDPMLPKGAKAPKLATKNSYVLELQCTRKEVVAIAGTQYDADPSNRLMFPAQAIRFLRKILGLAVPPMTVSSPTPVAQRLDGNLPPEACKITFLLYEYGYSPMELDFIEMAVQTIKSDIEEFIKPAPEINFCKIGGFNDIKDYLSKSRDKYLISQMNIYCHGVINTFAFGYGYQNQQLMNWTTQNTPSLPAYPFALDSVLESYACRTGQGVGGDDTVTPVIDNREQSLAQALANYFKIEVLAFVRRTDYADTWGTDAERYSYYRCSEASLLENVKGWKKEGVVMDEAWCKDFHERHTERELNINTYGFAFNIRGAYSDVRVSSKTNFTPEQIRFRPHGKT